MIDEAWKQLRDKHIYGTTWRTPERTVGLSEVMDIAPSITPKRCDWVAATTAQASTLLSEHGIRNIPYTGFDTNGCVWLSEGGMHAMGKLGYRTILLRDCTTGAETAESYPSEGLTRSFITLVETGSYTADSCDLCRCMERALAQSRRDTREGQL